MKIATYEVNNATVAYVPAGTKYAPSQQVAAWFVEYELDEGVYATHTGRLRNMFGNHLYADVPATVVVDNCPALFGGVAIHGTKTGQRVGERGMVTIRVK